MINVLQYARSLVQGPGYKILILAVDKTSLFSGVSNWLFLRPHFFRRSQVAGFKTLLFSGSQNSLISRIILRYTYLYESFRYAKRRLVGGPHRVPAAPPRSFPGSFCKSPRIPFEKIPASLNVRYNS